MILISVSQPIFTYQDSWGYDETRCGDANFFITKHNEDRITKIIYEDLQQNISATHLVFADISHLASYIEEHTPCYIDPLDHNPPEDSVEVPLTLNLSHRDSEFLKLQERIKNKIETLRLEKLAKDIAARAAKEKALEKTKQKDREKYEELKEKYGW